MKAAQIRDLLTRALVALHERGQDGAHVYVFCSTLLALNDDDLEARAAADPEGVLELAINVAEHDLKKV